MILRVLREARLFWPALGLLLVLNLLAVPVALLLPFPLRFMVDQVISGRPLPQLLEGWSDSAVLVLACVMEFVFVLINQAVTYLAWIYQTRTGEKIAVELRLRLFDHVQKLSLRTHDERGINEMIYRLQNDVASMQSLAVEGLIPFASTVMIFVAMAIVSFRIDALLTLLALIALPLTFFLSAVHMPRSRASWARVKETDQATVGVLQQALGATRVVRAFSQEKRETERLNDTSKMKLAALSDATLSEAAYGLATTAAVAAASAVALYVGVRHVRAGVISLGDFLLVMAYLAQLLRPLDRLSKYVSSTQSSLASAERVLQLFAREPDVIEKQDARPFTSVAKGEIEFANVSFGYQPSRSIIDSFSLHVRPGQRVGLVGSTGSGKTTVLGLLLRFFDPDQGLILLDGRDLKDYRLSDLRRQFAVILQEPVLFMGTLAENISYGRPDADLAMIKEAAKAAKIHDFIERLPLGYETRVGERGMTLSGGERQRLSIARAFLLDAPILLMDEPTSHLDSKTQDDLSATLDELQHGRTTITISHRPELLKNYDVILQLIDGRWTSFAKEANGLT